MALSKTARSKLSRLVQQSKKLLFSNIIDQLQKNYGIYPQSGEILTIDELSSNDSNILFKAKLLRDRLEYLKANLPDRNNEDIDSIDQLIREQAFTILNRFCALRMAEERNIIRETIRLGYQSEGFQVYDSITGQGSTTETFKRYNWFLNAIFDELALDLPAIFDRFSPYAILFPEEKSILDLLALINSDDLTIHREEGQQPINFWQQDETIGWIYQYYNSREEISAMREASENPRNSREMAVRNQFFTPRYIVQFLTDNSLGRIWYEMTKGKTTLRDFCTYLISRPDEIFLNSNQSKPENDNPNALYIEHRNLKDPREIKLLDPACGSMHFGLYAYELFEKIYLEAWDNHMELLSDLRNTITRAEFVKLIPDFIIRYNIHGVDIDPRALQMAALSLWLRAQKSFDKLGLQPTNRPRITKSNLVLAEPMPGNAELLSDVIKNLDSPVRKLILHIWDLMQMAGETGLLLRIEKEIDTKIQEIEKNLKEEEKNAQVEIGSSSEHKQRAKEAAKYASKEYREEFLDKAEEQVLKALKSLAEEANNGHAYRKMLFANDSARGFAFIELCRQKYDVIVMNPPFGAASVNSEKYISENYPIWAKNILAAFFPRMLELINNMGLCSAIYDRTVAIKSSYENFRKECLCGHITTMADTGWNVLEANVETTTVVIQKLQEDINGFFLNVLESENKDEVIAKLVNGIRENLPDSHVFRKKSLDFLLLPNSILGYYFEDHILKIFNENKSLKDSGYNAMFGSSIPPTPFQRLFWELSENRNELKPYYNGGGTFSLFYSQNYDLMTFGNEAYNVRYHKSTNIRNLSENFKPGVGYGKRGEILDAHILRRDFVFSGEGHAISIPDKEHSFMILSFLNSIYSQYIINLYCGQHKTNGYVNLLPLPSINFEELIIINKIINKILSIRLNLFSLDETCLEFSHLIQNFIFHPSLKKSLNNIQSEVNSRKQEYLSLIKQNDDFWLQKASVPKEHLSDFETYKNKRPHENLISIDGINDETIENNPIMAFEIVSNLLGYAFGRWDIRSIQNAKLVPTIENVFDPLPLAPAVYLSSKPKDYQIDFPEDGLLVQEYRHSRSISKAVENVVHEIWGNNGYSILFELSDLGHFTDLQEFFTKPSGFFDFHYNRYTKSRREAPIYWPLSTQSGSYTIWVYYPRLNDQTLYNIVNNIIKPKVDDIQAEVRQLKNNANLDNKGKKELQDKEELIFELLNFEKELLRVANLPYKPNHNDGVLITAAPLYNLFRHNKWHKSTEDCWKSLEKGDFDWSHLAYNIWTERVRKKCVKDLNIAIAHGLEDICEIKPKVPKENKKKQPKEIKKENIINFEK